MQTRQTLKHDHAVRRGEQLDHDNHATFVQENAKTRKTLSDSREITYAREFFARPIEPPWDRQTGSSPEREEIPRPDEPDLGSTNGNGETNGYVSRVVIDIRHQLRLPPLKLDTTAIVAHQKSSTSIGHVLPRPSPRAHSAASRR